MLQRTRVFRSGMQVGNHTGGYQPCLPNIFLVGLKVLRLCSLTRGGVLFFSEDPDRLCLSYCIYTLMEMTGKIKKEIGIGIGLYAVL